MQIETAYHDAVQQLQETYSLRSEAAAAVRLVLDHITGDSYAHLKHPQKVLLPAQQQHFETCLDQLLDGQPAPYVTGKREFYGRSFICDQRALIPRPESELLVEAAIGQFKDHAKVLLADLGCGSGCISVSVASELPQAHFIATDISADALALAHENAVKHGVADRIQFVQGAAGDWKGPLQKVLLDGSRLDGILTNPPYLPALKRRNVQKSVRDHEPDVALFGGQDGLDEHRRLAEQCLAVLQPEGYLWAEFGDGQYDAIRDIYQSAGWQSCSVVLDLAGIERMLCARRVISAES